MKFFKSDVVKLLLYIGLSFCVAALIVPWMYSTGKDLALYTQQNKTAEWLKWFGEKCGRAEFDRYFKRALLLCGVVFLVPLIYWVRRSSGVKGNEIKLGLKGEKKLKDFSFGFSLALFNMALVGAIAIYKEYFTFNESIDWLKIILSGVGTAILVSLVEEIIFRGCMQGVIQRSMKMKFVIFWTAFLFAFVHFTQPPDGVLVSDPVGWGSGFQFLLSSMKQLFFTPGVVLSFGSLMGIGVILSYARIVSGSLWLSIGLHAGWIMGYKVITRSSHKNPLIEPSFVFGENVREGALPLALILCAMGVVMHYCKRTYGTSHTE